jgi:hypothetical protein
MFLVILFSYILELLLLLLYVTFASPTAKEKNTEKIHNRKRSVDFDLSSHHCDVNISRQENR